MRGESPASDACEEAVRAAKQLILDVYRGDAASAWNSFSSEAQSAIINRGIRAGMAADIGARLLADTADDDEWAGFLADLLGGLRKDLEHLDMRRLVMEAEPEAPSRVRVLYLQEIDVAAGPSVPPLPAGSLVIVYERGEWKIDRLVPRPG